MCIIIDEASTLAKLSTLVIYVQCAIQSAPDPVMVFVDLKELSSTTAESVFNTLLSCLNEYGFTKDYLNANLIAFCSDGASTMLGKKSGVAAKLLEIFPNIIIWHCLNHRLQLALDDSINAIGHVNHFKQFLDKIYSIYHQSNKNQAELIAVAKDLQIEIIKIGRVLGPRWAACSLRSATAVWGAYPALYVHFTANPKFSGMAKRLANINFLKDLALMIDILEEISLLSIAMQSRTTNIQKANHLIKRSINAFNLLKTRAGKHEEEVDQIKNSEAFKCIPFENSKKFKSLPREKLLESIIENMSKRLLSNQASDEEDGFLNLLNILDPTTWELDKVLSPWFEGERKLVKLNEILKYKITVNDFRDFVEGSIVCKNIPFPETISHAKKIASTIAVSSAEAERGFSLMNNIVTCDRTRLKVEHVSDLMTINLIGKELKDWDASPFVKTWMRNHRLATDTRVRKRAELEVTSNQQAIWKLL